MKKMTFLIPLLLSLPALAEPIANPPSEPVSVMFVVVFAVIFVGINAGFFIYHWWHERHKKKAG
jgi:hypothetical protein